MKKGHVELFEKVNTQLEMVYEELTSLSKKSPNDAVNKFKLQFVNKILKDTNLLLDTKHRPFDDFSMFDEETLPTNSDVVFILAQYLSCMENLRAENVQQMDFSTNWYWVIDGTLSSIRTAPPKKLKGR